MVREGESDEQGMGEVVPGTCSTGEHRVWLWQPGKKGNMENSNLLLKERRFGTEGFLHQPQAWETSFHGFLDKAGSLSKMKSPDSKYCGLCGSVTSVATN